MTEITAYRCPKCESSQLHHVEDIPAARDVIKIEGNKIYVEGLISDYDYESGSNDRLECAECGTPVPVPVGMDFEFV